MAKGPMWMILATLAFTGMVTLVKIGRVELGYGPLELMVWRALAGIPLVWALTGMAVRVHRVDLMLLRCLFGFGAMFSFFSAARGLGVGELSVIVKLQPILVAMLAPLALGSGERSDRRVVGALLLGMAGTVALLWPDLREARLSAHVGAAMWAVSAACCSSVAHTTLRALGPTEDSRVVVFWFQLATGAGALLLLPVEGGMHLPPAPWAWATVLGVGVFAALGQLLMTRAYQVERAARVAAASYAAPLFGFLSDVVFFGNTPGPHALFGAVLVLCGGALVLRRA